jgi:hypothetical protein
LRMPKESCVFPLSSSIWEISRIASTIFLPLPIQEWAARIHGTRRQRAHFLPKNGWLWFLRVCCWHRAGLQGLTILLWVITSANRLIHRSFVTCLRSGLRKWTLLTDQQLIFKNYRRSHILWFPQNLKVADTLGVLIRNILRINLW